jgi:hypothetical protein
VIHVEVSDMIRANNHDYDPLRRGSRHRRSGNNLFRLAEQGVLGRPARLSSSTSESSQSSVAGSKLMEWTRRRKFTRGSSTGIAGQRADLNNESAGSARVIFVRR